MPSFSIKNFGCRVNQAEAFRWAEILKSGGLGFDEDFSRSDWILVNSCTLTARADRDVRKFVRGACRKSPRAKLVVTGCYAERTGEELKKIPQVALVVPNSDKDSIPDRILGLVESPVKTVDGSPGRRNSDRGDSRSPESGGLTEFGAGEDPERTDFEDADFSYRSRALVKIQDGCNGRCAFCIIPSVRGQSVSVPGEDVRRRIDELVAQGYREIVLAGIHLSSYGEDRSPRSSLLDLLRDISDVDGLGRIRLSSLDPGRMDDELVSFIAGNPRICQHFHLSLQHASPRILKKMGRAVEPGRYEEVLSALRKGSQEAGLGADIMVGFPEESDDDFRILRDFLDKSPLTYFHVFPFSARPGTSAARRRSIRDSIVKDRSMKLRRLSAEKNLGFRRLFVGRTLDAVVIRKRTSGGKEEALPSEESRSARTKSRVELLSGNYIKIFAEEGPASGRPVSGRELVSVCVERVSSERTEGKILA